MSIIKTHDIYLFSGNSQRKIVLKPLCDSHLEYLYKWYADPEVLYWTESGRDGTPISYDEETVRKIYGGVSQNALCFLVEADGKAVGDCWLQKMNLPGIIKIYPEGTDIRRIDMAIGEKTYWGKGIGTVFVGMLIDFAFNSEKADVIHCFCEDYNIRSRRVWERNNFSLVMEKKLPEGLKGKWEYHYRLTRKEYLSKPLLLSPPLPPRSAR